MLNKVLGPSIVFLFGLAAGILLRLPVGQPDRKPAADPTRPQAGRISRHIAFMQWAGAHRGSEVLFLGDSITDFWHDVPDLWCDRFPKAANFGVGLDRIEHVLWRVENGEVEAVRPRVVVLLVGANNLTDCDAPEIVRGTRHLIAAIRGKQPGVKILLMGMLPTDMFGMFGRGVSATVRAVNCELAKEPGVTLVDLGPKLLKPDGSFDQSLQPDHLHLSPAGYRVWADAIRGPLERLLSE